MRSSALLMLVVGSLIGLGGCGQRPPPAPPPEPVKPVSAWSSADSQAVAKELAESAEHQEWLVGFKTSANRTPKVLVGEIQDHSGDHVDVAELANDLAADLKDSQQVSLVDSPEEADFVFTGSVGREVIPGGARYPVDLRLTGKAGDPVWVGGLERTILTPVAAPSPAAATPTPATGGSTNQP